MKGNPADDDSVLQKLNLLLYRAFSWRLFFFDFHGMSVESMIETVLMGHRRMVEERRKSTEKFEQFGKLIRANAEAILTLERAITKFQNEIIRHW